MGWENRPDLQTPKEGNENHYKLSSLFSYWSNIHWCKSFKSARYLLTSSIQVAYKLFNSKLPPYFLNNFVSPNGENHIYNTRGRLTLSTPRFWHEYYRQLLRFRIVNTINTAPLCKSEKIHTHSLNGFSNYIFKHLISKYSRICNVQNCFICNRLWYLHLYKIIYC